MKCVVPGINLKVFGRAIHSLAKIGDELYFEPLEQGLSLRTVNLSRSAYACFLFFPSYFQHYDDGRKQTDSDHSDDDDDDGLRCKITVKSIMAIFRSLSTIERTVEKCKIFHNAREARLVFELHCRHGIVKKHNLAYIECETLQAIFSKDLCPNKLTAPSKLFCEVVVNFQTTQEEITLSVRPDILSLKNYVEDEPDPNKVVHTELSLAPEEFDLYQVGVDTDITFCLKELRAILAFGETTGLPLNINFEAAGRPVTLSIDSDQTFEANFVLATLADLESTSSQQPASQAASVSQRKHSATAATSKHGKNRKPAHTDGSASTSQKTTEQDNRNGPQSLGAGLEDLEGITEEELAAAMEVEEEWEKADRDRASQGTPSNSKPAHRSQSDCRNPSPQSDKVQHDQDREHRLSDKPKSRREVNEQDREHRLSDKPESRREVNKQDREHRLSDKPESHRDKHNQKSVQRLSHNTKSHRGMNSQDCDQRLSHKPDSHRLSHKDKRSHGADNERSKSSHPDSKRKRPAHCSEDRNVESADREKDRHGGEEGGRKRSGGERQVSRKEEEKEEGEGGSSSPVIPVQCVSADVTRQGACLQPLSDEEDDLDDTVPGTPPSAPPAKKFRSLFFGSSQKPSQPPRITTILAADTDDED